MGKKLIVESQDLPRQIEETENAIAALGKSKVSLSTQLEDTKRLADAEARDRASLLTKYKNLATDCECAYEEEQRQRQEVVERATLADRRANALAGEMEEARSLLDSAERGKRQTEAELSESRHAVNEMTSINSKAASDKRAVESAVHTMHAEIDDMLQQAKNSEEKAKKAMVDAARLADELRAEQDHTNTQTKAKRALEAQLASLRTSSTTRTRTRSAEVAPPWPSWIPGSGILRWSLATCRPGPARTPRDSRSQNAAPRSSPSRSTRTRRIRTGCLTLPTSCSPRSRRIRSRSRRQRRSPPSTWPSSGRLSRSWRRLRSAPSLPRLRCASRL